MEFSDYPGAVTTEALEHKLAHLQRLLCEMGSVLVCFSGGVDSAFLLAAAHQALGEHALGITAISPSLPPGEREEAATIARTIGAPHMFVESHEIDNPHYATNGADRCFHCKTELYSLASAESHKRGFAHVVSGIITDDLGDYRPGLEAARQHGVRFPLVDAGFHKADVRAAAAQLGLSIWDKPAAACLSSRIPYGTAVTPERLSKIGTFEAQLKRLGFRQVRVRYHESGIGASCTVIARIELNLDELPKAALPQTREAIVNAGKHCGFQFVTLDLAGYRTGSHNEVLQGKSLKIVSLPTCLLKGLNALIIP